MKRNESLPRENVRALRKKNQRQWWLCALPLYVFTLLFVAGPLLYMLAISFFEQGAGGWGVTPALTLENYAKIFDPVYGSTFSTSLVLALETTAITLLVGYPFGYFMAKSSPKNKRRLMVLVVVPFWTNALVRMYGWIIFFRSNGLLDTALMGLGLTSEPLRLLYSYPAVLTGMVYALLPFMVLAVYSSAEKLDWSLWEAARDLGASRIRAFCDVTLKLTLPGILSGVILTFIPSMGLFFIADILGGGKFVLVGNLIRDQMFTSRNWPFAAALAVVLTILTTLLIQLYRKITRTDELEGLL